MLNCALRDTLVAFLKISHNEIKVFFSQKIPLLTHLPEKKPQLPWGIPVPRVHSIAPWDSNEWEKRGEGEDHTTASLQLANCQK